MSKFNKNIYKKGLEYLGIIYDNDIGIEMIILYLYSYYYST